GVGSEFVVEVKLGISEKSKKAAKPNLDMPFEDLKVLIVDDDLIICQHTQQVLQDMCVHAEYVISGAKALEAVRQKWSKKEFFDIILVDWK
ncbi:MAG: hypothetical protein RSC60_07515, partial [Christensenellaceae bacterium]